MLGRRHFNSFLFFLLASHFEQREVLGREMVEGEDAGHASSVEIEVRASADTSASSGNLRASVVKPVPTANLPASFTETGESKKTEQRELVMQIMKELKQRSDEEEKKGETAPSGSNILMIVIVTALSVVLVIVVGTYLFVRCKKVKIEIDEERLSLISGTSDIPGYRPHSDSYFAQIKAEALSEQAAKKGKVSVNAEQPEPSDELRSSRIDTDRADIVPDEDQKYIA
ncbi:unnamed protein product [Amoebophrya sp. A120]|nr:unnamed protein product [Amoebophrya sp. A120]|eukprot:GSA120T00004430001.1